MSIISKEQILSQVKIEDLIEEFGLEYDYTSSGNFDLRCRCPSVNHNNGGERTPSLYVDTENNNFHCFGCQAGSNSIDFYMLCRDISFSEAFSELSIRVDPSKKVNIVKKESNFKILLDISNLFRETMLSNPNDLKWINELMMKTDLYLENIKSHEISKTRSLFKSLDKRIKERYNVENSNLR